MERQQLANDIRTTFSEIGNVLASISEDNINTVPFSGSWTAAQVAQHIVLYTSGFDKMMHEKIGEPKENPEGLIGDIKKTFLDFNTKMQSPDFIKPEKKVYQKDELAQKLQGDGKNIVDDVKTLDLAKTCLSFEVPVLGFLSRAEAAHFVLYHSQRHLHQLKNVRQKLNEKITAQ